MNKNATPAKYIKTDEANYSQTPSSVYLGVQTITVEGGFKKADGTMHWDSTNIWTYTFKIKNICLDASAISISAADSDKLIHKPSNSLHFVFTGS